MFGHCLVQLKIQSSSEQRRAVNERLQEVLQRVSETTTHSCSVAHFIIHKFILDIESFSNAQEFVI